MANPIMFSFLLFFGLCLRHPRGEVPGFLQDDYLILSTFKQLIDHDNESQGSFDQRYYNSFKFDLYNQSGGLTKTKNIILDIAGESDSFGASGTGTDTISLIAKDLSARVLTLEHRFFGQSHPVSDTTTTSLELLTVHQVLEDLAYFRNQYMENNKDQIDENAKWLITGGSYSGMMSALSRRMHPECFHAAISSSGVVLANDNYTDFDLQDAVSMGQECAAAAREARIRLMRITERSEEDYQYITQLFNMEGLNHSDFYFVVGEMFTLALQYNAVAQVCSPLVDAVRTNSDLVEALAKFAREYFIPRFCGSREGLLETYDRKHMLDQQSKNTGTGSRSWLWMTCNELAYWQVSPGRVGLRPEQLNQDYFREQCRFVFPEREVFPDVAAFNQKYGGLDQTTVTRVYYTTGSQDPWTWTCITEKEQAGPNCFVHTITGPEMGHCSDLHAPSADEPIDLTRTRDHMRQAVLKWMSEDDE